MVNNGTGLPVAPLAAPVALVDQDLYLQVVVVVVAAQVTTVVVEVPVMLQFLKLLAVVDNQAQLEVVEVVVQEILQVLVLVVLVVEALEAVEEAVEVDYLLLLLEEMLQ